jgi:hypothetical protein
MADVNHFRNAWNQSEAFNLGLLAYYTRFMGGPGKQGKNFAGFSSLLVDGKAQINKNTIGKIEFFQENSNGGYVIVDGGEKYNSLGISEIKRHLSVNFNDNYNQAIITTLDHIEDEEQHSYTWQLNLGDEQNNGEIDL